MVVENPAKLATANEPVVVGRILPEIEAEMAGPLLLDQPRAPRSTPRPPRIRRRWCRSWNRLPAPAAWRSRNWGWIRAPARWWRWRTSDRACAGAGVPRRHPFQVQL